MPKIFAFSDSHGFTKGIEIPRCDLLIHAGDICADGNRKMWFRHFPGMSMRWFEDIFKPWLQPHLDSGHIKNITLTWGNHDWTDRFETEKFNANNPGWDILIDCEVTVQGLRIWGSPWSNEFNGWAWMKWPELLKAHYDAIPEGIDVIISHQPPQGYGGNYYDVRTHTESSLGSIELLEAIDRVQPKAVICGHIHRGYGIYKRGKTTIYNVSVVDEQYRLVNPVTEILL